MASACRSLAKVPLQRPLRIRGSRLYQTASTRPCDCLMQRPSTASRAGVGASDPKWLARLSDRVQELRRSRESSENHIEQLTGIGSTLSRSWLELLAGSEGYLTEDRFRGLNAHSIQWGDMVSLLLGIYGHILLLMSSLANFLGQHGHVNNVMYNKFAESARVNWFMGFLEAVSPETRHYWAGLMSPRGTGLILKSIKTDYKVPIKYPDSITIIHKLAEKPEAETSSVYLDAVMFSHQPKRVAARFEEEIVAYDYGKSAKTTLPHPIIQTLTEVHGSQERQLTETTQWVTRASQLVDAM